MDRGSLLERLKVSYPIIQAPMAGGGDTPELVAAVSNAGGMGFFGAAYSSPEQIAKIGEAIRERTDRPFGVNLFAPVRTGAARVDAMRISGALERVWPYYTELGIQVPTTLDAPGYSLKDQVEASLEIEASVLSWTFGMMPEELVQRAKSRGLVVMGTATTVEEARQLERSGVDAVIAQGAEAGGHRGTFGARFADAMIGTMSLVPQVVDAVEVPVIASGGIMDGRGVAAALVLGAEAVQMGTAFLTCDEAGVPEVYKKAILNAREDEIETIEVFSGRPARGIRNRFSDEMKSSVGTEAVLPFPLQNAVTRSMRQAAAKQGRAEFLSLWAGQGVRMARRQSAAELVKSLVEEMKRSQNPHSSHRKA